MAQVRLVSVESERPLKVLGAWAVKDWSWVWVAPRGNKIIGVLGC